MYSMEDPLKKCVSSLVEMVMARLETPEKLEELDLILGKVFENVELKVGMIKEEMVL
jgi:hypothetical protein